MFDFKVFFETAGMFIGLLLVAAVLAWVGLRFSTSLMENEHENTFGRIMLGSCIILGVSGTAGVCGFPKIAIFCGTCIYLGFVGWEGYMFHTDRRTRRLWGLGH